MTLDPEKAGTKRTLPPSIFPHFCPGSLLSHANSSHEEQHMNENIKRKKKNKTGTWERSKISLMRFFRLKPAAYAQRVGVHQCEIYFASMAQDRHCSRQREGRSGSWRGKFFKKNPLKHRNVMILRLWRHTDFITQTWGCLYYQISGSTGAYEGGKKSMRLSALLKLRFHFQSLISRNHT